MAQINEIQKREILEIIYDKHPHIDIEELHDKMNLFEDLGFDALDHVELVMDLEVHFNISISDYEWDRVSTIDEVYNIVNDKL